jgi:hypothetical protein
MRITGTFTEVKEHNVDAQYRDNREYLSLEIVEGPFKGQYMELSHKAADELVESLLHVLEARRKLTD